MSLFKVLAIFCFLHLAFGVEFAHARPLYTRLDATAGSKLVIPCVVTTIISLVQIVLGLSGE